MSNKKKKSLCIYLLIYVVLPMVVYAIYHSRPNTLTYPDGVYILTASENEQYNSLKDDYINTHLLYLTGESVGNLNPHYSDMSEKQINEYKKYIIKKIETSVLTYDEAKQTWTDFYKGKEPAPYLPIETLMPDRLFTCNLPYDELSAAEREAVKEAFLEQAENNLITDEEARRLWNDFVSGKTTYEVNIELTGIFSELAPSKQAAVVNELTLLAEEHAKSEMYSTLTEAGRIEPYMLIFAFVLTLLVYTFIPTLIYILSDTITKRWALVITVLNSVSVWIFFSALILLTGGTPSSNAGPMLFWGITNYQLLKKKVKPPQQQEVSI